MRAFRAPARIGAPRSLAAQRRLARDDNRQIPACDPREPNCATDLRESHYTEFTSDMGFQAAQPWLSTTNSRPLKPMYCQRWSRTCAAVELLRRIQTDS